MNESAINQTNSPFCLRITQWEAYTAKHFEQAEMITINRKQRPTWRSLLQAMSQKKFRIHGKLHSSRLEQDIIMLLQDITPNSENVYFVEWRQDIVDIAQHFCHMMQIDYTWLSLTSNRVCSKFHVDKTDMRLLVTYCGQGTQWMDTSMSNPTIQSIPAHHISLFKGNAKHIQHRSPTLEYPSILLRLDTPYFKTQNQ